MTVDNVKKILEVQLRDDPGSMNDHGITLQRALVPPEKITIIVRIVRNGKIKENNEEVWLVGCEPRDGGYRIIMRDDGLQLGLASNGFPHDSFLVFVGWYGSLVSTFLAM